MIRTQISLTDHQMEALRRVAARRRVSMAAVIRDAVDMVTDAEEWPERRKRALAAGGRFASDRADVSVHHDEYLAVAFGR
ncbi:MAG: ribbon-helix-helix protein, CopG family [Acidimicrobiales bacterium]